MQDQLAIPQQELIDELLQEEKYLMIVLDACRYDYLKERTSLGWDWYGDGELRKARSPAYNTYEWMNKVWRLQYDLIYVSPMPYISSDPVEHPSKPPHLQHYHAGKHFSHVIDCWEWGWDDEIDTMRPHVIRDVTKAIRDKPRIIAHFEQPHSPYIGEPTIIPERDYGANSFEELVEEVGIDKLKEAYMGNLVHVIEEGVKPLWEVFDDRKIVITADHGEALGEKKQVEGEYGTTGELKMYGHNQSSKWVNEVPWIEIE